MPKYLEVLVNLPLMQSFTYQNLEDGDKKFSPACKNVDIGYRVEVPFGQKNARKMTAAVVAVYDELPPKCKDYEDKIKKITGKDTKYLGYTVHYNPYLKMNEHKLTVKIGDKIGYVDNQWVTVGGKTFRIDR